MSIFPPDIANERSYEDIKTAILTRVYKDGEVPTESDDVMLCAEAFAYELALKEKQFNDVLRNLFLTTARDKWLDLLGNDRAVKRKEGAYPFAQYKFELQEAVTNDVVIPKGFELTDESTKKRAQLTENLVIAQGETSVFGKVELLEYVVSSEVKCEQIVTPSLYIKKATMQGEFSNGAQIESDDRYRERIFLSYEQTTTTGSRNAYIKYAKDADARISDVEVFSPSDCRVDVVCYAPLEIASTDLETIKKEHESKPANEKAEAIRTAIREKQQPTLAVIQKKVEDVVTADDVRPLCDKIEVRMAQEKDIVLNASLEIFAGQDQGLIEKTARENLINTLKTKRQINNYISVSLITSLLHIQGIKSVKLNNLSADIETTNNEVNVLEDFNLTLQVEVEQE